MPRTCTVCTHVERGELNAALVAGEPMRAIASRAGVSRAALQRHRADHLPAVLLRAADVAVQEEADALLAKTEAMLQRARAYEAQAVANGDLRAALAALREQRATMEFLVRINAVSEIPHEAAEVVHKVVWIDPDGEVIGEDTLPLIADGPKDEYILALKKARVLAGAGIRSDSSPISRRHPPVPLAAGV